MITLKNLKFCLMTALILMKTSHSFAMDPGNIFDLEIQHNQLSYYQNYTHRLAEKALQKANITESLTSIFPLRGGFGEVYFTDRYAIKISADDDGTELNRLQTVARNLRATPPQGFEFNTPHILFQLYRLDYSFLRTKLTANIQIMNKTHSVKRMSQVFSDATKRNSLEDQKIIGSLGIRLAELQTTYLVIKPQGEPDVTALHGDFSPANILLTAIPQKEKEATFTLIDNGSFRRGIDAYPGKLPTDALYFLYKATIELYYSFTPDETQFKHHIRSEKSNLHTTIKHFYTGYLSRLPENTRKKLSSLYSTTTVTSNDNLPISVSTAYDLAEKDELNLFPTFSGGRTGYILLRPGARKKLFLEEIMPIEMSAFKEAFKAFTPNLSNMLSYFATTYPHTIYGNLSEAEKSQLLQNANNIMRIKGCSGARALLEASQPFQTNKMKTLLDYFASTYPQSTYGKITSTEKNQILQIASDNIENLDYKETLKKARTIFVISKMRGIINYYANQYPNSAYAKFSDKQKEQLLQQASKILEGIDYSGALKTALKSLNTSE